MQSLPAIKQGDTFAIGCLYENASNVAESVANYTIRSQVRSAATKKLVQEFTIYKANQTTNPGVFSITSQTTGWPIGSILMDIEIHDGSTVISSETITFQVEQDQTHD